jgi:hypothetical protein
MSENLTYTEIAEEQGLTPQMVEDWWNSTDYWQMENITHLRREDFDPEDGYQEFVDACDEWWNKRGWEDKLSVFFENN